MPVVGVAVEAVGLGRHHCGCGLVGQSQLRIQVASGTRPVLKKLGDGPSRRQTCDCVLFASADYSLSAIEMP